MKRIAIFSLFLILLTSPLSAQVCRGPHAGIIGAAGGSGASIGFDNASVGAIATAADSLTVEHTTGAGSNRALVVGVYAGGGDLVPGVAYNGVALTKATSLCATGTTACHSVWYLVAPASGAHNIVASAPTATAIRVLASSWTGVHQTVPVGSAASSGAYTGGITVDATTEVGDMVVDAAKVPTTSTEGAGQTLRINSTGYYMSSEEATGTSTTMSWTYSPSGWASIIAIPLKRANP